jgi:tRNA (guanine37-N1)-methyltransferase
MHFDIVTIFPELFAPFSSTGVLGRAVARGTVTIAVWDLRSWADNRWHRLDDEPYGGGAGMVIQAPPLLAAVRELERRGAPARTILLTPRGRPFDQAMAERMALESRVMLLCGRYEGFDERATEILGPEEISVGDFILGGGEVAAMAVVETVSRLIPGVVGDPRSVEADSFAGGLLDYPCYTRPPQVEGREVPEVLLSGNHELIRRWRLERSVELTVTRRPDLIESSWERYSDEVRELVRRLAPDLAASCAADRGRRGSLERQEER